MFLVVFVTVSVVLTKALEIRLGGGNSSLEGRLEVNYNGTWGTVCDDHFDENEARVVCKMLGLTGGIFFVKAHFGAGNGTIWMDDLNCSGNELSLDKCPFLGWGREDCSHSEDVGVSCNALLKKELTKDPDRIHSGSYLELSCSTNPYEFPMPESALEWDLNGVPIKPRNGSRFQIMTYYASSDHRKEMQSVLHIEPVMSKDAGNYSCRATIAKRSEIAMLQIEQVLVLPNVVLSPSSIAVHLGSSVTFKCILVQKQNIPTVFNWYKDGNPFSSSNDTESSVEEIRNISSQFTMTCQAKNEVGNGATANSSVTVKADDTKTCPANNDTRGTFWSEMAAGTVNHMLCSQNYNGLISRTCSVNGLWMPALYNCTPKAIADIKSKIEMIKEGVPNDAIVSVTLDKLANATKPEQSSLMEGGLQEVIEIMDIVTEITSALPNTSYDTTKHLTESFLDTSSNLLDERNYKSWQTLNEVTNTGAGKILQSTEHFVKSTLEGMARVNNETTLEVRKQNLVTAMVHEEPKDVTFPRNNGEQIPDWVANSTNTLHLPAEALNTKEKKWITYSVSLYRNIEGILTSKTDVTGKGANNTLDVAVNSRVMSFQVEPKPLKLQPPIQITFEHISENFSNPICSFWNSRKGLWSSEGCKAGFSNATITRCYCDHLTNFAILMSPGKPKKDSVHNKVLSIISVVGCSLSLACLCATLIIHVIVWRYIKSVRAWILTNLCIALIIAYVLFLAGVNRTENKDICTATAALLHYFYLAVFFLMLVEGIEVGVAVTFVVFTQSKLLWLLPAAWGIPAVIVAISLGVTQLEGYGTKDHCWLSTDNKLIIAFVGPALTIILINCIVIALVYKRMLHSMDMLKKEKKDRIRSSLRSLCVLLPVMGLTWVFGVLSVNEDAVVFQYVFAICNTMQGVFIFIFHCFLNKQVRDGFKIRRAKQSSQASIDGSNKTMLTSQGQKLKRNDLDGAVEL